MFQCIIQQRSVWGTHAPPSDAKEAFPDIRLQLNEQLKCLDGRVEAQGALASELQDYFRRRAELEADYSRGLDKLARTLHLRHKEHKHKREQWGLFSSYSCWQQLVGATRALARDHAALAELYGGALCARLASAAEDAARVYRKCRDIGYESHEEILRVLADLHGAMKTHAQYAAEWRAAAAKLRAAHAQRARAAAADAPRTKKLKVLDKEVDKRRSKHSDAKLKALKARSEYVLCLEAANTTIHKYFVDDLSDLIDCMDLGFHNCVSRALRMHASADEGRARALQTQADTMYGCVDALDSRLDKQRFLEAHHQPFMVPRKISYQGTPPDQEYEQDVENAAEQTEKGASPASATSPGAEEAQLRSEMECRLAQLEARVQALRTESAEACKTLEAAERNLLQMVDVEDWDTRRLFGAAESGGGGTSSPHDVLPPHTLGAVPPTSATDVGGKARADRQETEDFYLAKFREYLMGSGRIARLESKAAVLRAKLGAALARPSTAQHNIPRHRRRVGRAGSCGMFAAPLEEHLEATRRDLPLVLTSCIRVINLYGLQHQGIFRVSGSQVEIAALREWFERGEDPLVDVSDASDINSVAGLLKLYLRELRPPLIPIVYLEHLLQVAQLESRPEFVQKMREFVTGLPRPAMVLLRYLFAFLNHVLANYSCDTDFSAQQKADLLLEAISYSQPLHTTYNTFLYNVLCEFSEENMMDAWNLAICFGPTLLPVPEEREQVHCQNLLNELVKNLILLHEDIFPRDAPPYYDKYQAPLRETEDAGTDAHDDMDSEASLYPSEDEGSVSAAGGEEATPEAGAGNTRHAHSDMCVHVHGDSLCGVAERTETVRACSCCRAEGAAETAAAGLDSGQIEEAGPEAEEEAEEEAGSECEGDATVFTQSIQLWQQRAANALKQTPDLVLDLPAGSEPPPPSPAPTPATAADNFLSNHNTLKKKPASPLDKEWCGDCGEESVAPAPEGSPVPPRNTRRVAAKFAELTLTGGSLKPAVAAKPAALLRKPHT